MASVSVRGVVAPVAVALVLAAGYLAMRINQPFFLWSSISFTFAGLKFGKDARRLLTEGSSDGDA